jgi:A/G-specific adenine glycosylase
MPFSMSAVQHRNKKSGDIAAKLLAHYDVHARTLPWRMPRVGGLPDPYHVWLSEIMLQQTTVAAVISYFEKFKSRWPNFAALAAAEDADVMAAWAGLGYYARARNLLKCARIVAAQHGGVLPDNEAELLKLPGIGPYTAAAISAIAFGNRAVVMDANVERVAARLFAIDAPLPASKPIIYAAIDQITPDLRSGDFAQAMMDLGAGHCRIKSPSCPLCPVSLHCDALHYGNAETLPVKAPKKAKPTRTGTAYWIERGGQVWLIQRGETGMLAGMRALPDDGWSVGADGTGQAPLGGEWQILDGIVRHSFTHFHLELRVAAVTVENGQANLGAGAYWPLNSLDNAGLPTLFRKAAKLVMSQKPVKINR